MRLIFLRLRRLSRLLGRKAADAYASCAIAIIAHEQHGVEYAATRKRSGWRLTEPSVFSGKVGYRKKLTFQNIRKIN
ncbi:hypothetical protein [uncultured Devosia sp.]|uniref:hypothetical protein n=1 Tax=uncultured Devosia sp. TaxID=211434 RepID=UPI00260458AB|nr:hypothetical protein [uncultured Devosia sp.]